MVNCAVVKDLASLEAIFAYCCLLLFLLPLFWFYWIFVSAQREKKIECSPVLRIEIIARVIKRPARICRASFTSNRTQQHTTANVGKKIFQNRPFRQEICSRFRI